MRKNITPILLTVGSLFFIAAFFYFFYTSPATRIGPEQPIPFSHNHHVRQIGIDCRYCHSSVEDAAFAGMPPTATCMNCHKQIWADSPMLEPVRESFRTGEPLRWILQPIVLDSIFVLYSP